MAAKRTRLKTRDGGRFDRRRIADRLDGLREMAAVEPKDVAGMVWPNQSAENAARSWYKRTTQLRQDFTLPEIELAVDYLLREANRKGKLAAKVLPGFPFVDIWVSLAIEQGRLQRDPSPHSK